jgi:hypothetical protein
MTYNKYYDHHSDEYNPQGYYNGMDYNDYLFEQALNNLDLYGE